MEENKEIEKSVDSLTQTPKIKFEKKIK